MPIEISHTGKVYGRLTVLKEVAPRYVQEATRERKVRQVYCKCECGKKQIFGLRLIVSGRTRSCGCLKEESSRKSYPKHGFYNTNLYTVYRNMLSRCYNKNAQNYSNYGGRGIIVCREWREDSVKFFEWALANGYEQGLQLDREKNNKNYTPTNCRFVTGKVNSNNTRNNIYVKIKGKKLSVTQACEQLKIISASGAFSRIEAGMDPLKAVTTPKKRVRNAS